MPKTRKVLLPTTQIFFEHRHFEPVLGFYSEGVRGLIRDLTLLNPERTYRREARQALRERVLAEYDSSVDLRFLENTLAHSEYAPFLVELALEEIDVAVGEMMDQFFHNLIFDICTKRWQWIGADLLLMITIWQ